MAEIISRKKGNIKTIPKVDLTPMVDLGFLLITFFIITTSMTTPNVLDLKNTANGNKNTTAESKTLSLILSNKNLVYYYFGNDSAHYKICNYSSENGLRKIITQHQQLVEKKFGNKAETVILIKPTLFSNYNNIVAVLDEMLICNIKKYLLVDATSFDESFEKK